MSKKRKKKKYQNKNVNNNARKTLQTPAVKEETELVKPLPIGDKQGLSEEDIIIEEADLIEEDLIYYYKKIGKSYNVTSGGEGVVGLRHSEETKKKLSEAKKGSKNPNYHKVPSKEWVDMIVKIKSVPVLQYSKSGEFIKRWESIAEAGRELGIERTNISRAMRGERKTAGGYKWIKRGEDKPPLE